MRDFGGWLFDLDGVIYRGEQLLDGASELIHWLDDHGRKVIFLSNNSTATPEEVTAKLRRLRVPDPEGRVVTAGAVAVDIIARRHPGARVFVLGLPAITQLVERANLRSVWQDSADGDVPDVVLSALDRTLTYDRLNRGLRAVLGGASFYSVNRDPRLPVEDGFEPGTGAITVALEYASGRQAEIVGKPAPGIVLEAVRRMQLALDQTIMFGDGLDLDIVAGHAAGVTTALVLTGLTSAEQAKAAEGVRKPEMVFTDLTDVLAALRKEL